VCLGSDPQNRLGYINSPLDLLISRIRAEFFPEIEVLGVVESDPGKEK
jgi:hypothetical protein